MTREAKGKRSWSPRCEHPGCKRHARHLYGVWLCDAHWRSHRKAVRR